MNPAPVLLEVSRGVACVTLNRPDRLNASNGAMSRELSRILEQASQSAEVRVILLRGAGRGFCAGADTEVLNQLSADDGESNERSKDLRYDGIMQLPKPVIAAVHGPCAGIGLALACACDFRLAAENAFFLAPFARLALCAESGLAWLLARAMGPGNAAEMLMCARRIGSREAYEKGLVAKVMPDEGFSNAAFEYAACMAEECAPSSFALMKRQLRDAPGQDFDDARAQAEMMTRDTLGSKDFREAVAARREDRAPEFSAVTAEFGPPISL